MVRTYPRPWPPMCTDNDVVRVALQVPARPLPRADGRFLLFFLPYRDR